MWAWPDASTRSPEGRLQLQVGGHAPGRGHFVVIDIDPIGQGSIQQDEFGLSPLYVATHGAFSFVANRPDLAASALHRVMGQKPERDRRFAALLAFKGYPMGDRTGYRQVRCVPFGTLLRVSPAGVRIVQASSPPWLPADHGASEPIGDPQEAIGAVEALLTAEMRRAVAGQPIYAGRPALQLTGGRDSRLSIAIALRSGAIKGLDVITHGAARTADARIARRVAASANVRHSLHRWTAEPESLFDHVRTTSGALNLWEASEPPSSFRRAMIVSGLLGETFRSNFPATAPLSTRSLVLRAFFDLPNLDLLTESAWTQVFVDAIELLMAPLAQGAKTEDLHDAFYLQHRIRRWIAVRPEAFKDTFFPLYSPPTVRLAFALGWQARVQNRIHDAIIARAGHGLADIAYAGAKQVRRPWRSAIDYPDGGAPVQDRSKLEQIARSWYPARPVWRLQPTTGGHPDTETARRMSMYREIIAARDANPAFDVIDKPRLLSAIQALPTLQPHLAKQIHGAMASVIWLGELEGAQSPWRQLGYAATPRTALR